MSGLKRQSSHPLVQSGDLYFNLNNYQEAIKFYDKAIKTNRNNKEALLGKGLALRELGKYDDAISCFNEYIEIDKEDITGLVEKANIYICQGQYNEATHCFDLCLKIDKKSPTAFNGKGLILDLMDAHHPAIQFYNKAIAGRKDADTGYIWANKGHAWYALERDDEALMCYSQAISLNKNEVSALAGKAKFYKKNGMDEEANKIYDDILNIDPNYMALIWMNEGISLHSESKYIDAINSYDKIIQIRIKYKILPQYVSLIYMNKGLSFYALEKYGEAINCYEEALRLDSPYLTLAWIGKGAAQDKLSYPDLAIECYKKALDLDPKQEIVSITNIVYLHEDESYSFVSVFDNVLVSSLGLQFKMKLNQLTKKPPLDPDLEDIALNGYQGTENFASKYPDKKISQEELLEIRNATSEIGMAGEEYINAYLESLREKGEIRDFKWVSKENASSPYDFCIMNMGGEKILIDVKSTQGSFDNLIHISYGELKKMVLGPEKYEIYRVYKLSEGGSKLKISSSMKLFASGIFDIFKGLPDGVIPEGISVATSLLDFGALRIQITYIP
jgi:tetratricopeptide (TPR) repeat protein